MQQPSHLRVERRPASREDPSFDPNRWFEDVLNRSVRGWTSWSPAADLFETDDEYVLELELPGFSREDIELTLEQGILTVTGERQAEEDERRAYRVRERAFGRFTRSFTLPRSVDAEDVDAEFRNGVLRVTMAKTPEAKPRRIEVHVK